MKDLWAWFSQPAATSADSDAVKRIADELVGLDEDTARFLAAFAFLLTRVAAVDHDISAHEAAIMGQIVTETGGLPPDRATLVVKLAVAEQHRVGGTDGFLVTRELVRIATYAQRVAIIRCLFAVATADERVHHQEGEEIGRIARELRIEPSDLSKIRVEYRQYL
jgi:uncharacterized tellurite resistance protein B-like protein